MNEKKDCKIKVLQVLGSTGLGGAESRIMDLYKNIDRDKVQFDFLVHMDGNLYKQALAEKKNPADLRKSEFYDNQIKELGGEIYVLPRFRIYNYLFYKREIKRFFAAHKDYRVVHGHMTSTASIYLPIAKKAGVEVTVAHARSAGVDAGLKGKLTAILRKNLWKRADRLFACSDLAAQSVFGEHEAVYIPNAIDTERFVFDEAIRASIRQEMGVEENTFLCGHVGRFHYAKNHEYLLELFAKLLAIRPDSKLLLLGEGPAMADRMAQAEELGIADRVIFAGNKKDPQRYYHAMDAFVFPSRYEGLPGTVIEAQASGLPCLLSDAIAKETQATNLVEWASIKDAPKVWAERINHLKMNPPEERIAGARLVKEAGFDVKEQALRMQNFYLTGEI